MVVEFKTVVTRQGNKEKGTCRDFWGSGDNTLFLDLGTSCVMFYFERIHWAVYFTWLYCIYVMHQLKVPSHPKEVTAVSHLNDRKVDLDSQCRTWNWESTQDPRRKQAHQSRLRAEMGTHEKSCAMCGCSKLKFILRRWCRSHDLRYWGQSWREKQWAL